MDTKELEKEMPHTWHLLKKMCDMVKAPYKIVNTPQWFAKYSWNETQEKEFENYFVDYLYNNSDARKELMNFPRKNKKYIKKVFSCFNFNYGWKRNDYKI